jgi:DNA repair exonuclease SbcCD ATPase subunit
MQEARANMDINDFIANRQTCLKWLRMPGLTPAEASALLLGYDPSEYAKLRNTEAKELARRFRELEQEVARKFPQRDVRDRSPVIPERLVNWALEIELELPEPLQGAIEKLFGDRQATAKHIVDHNAQLEALKAENAELTRQVARLEKKVTQLKNDEIQPKTKISLQKMALVMAVTKYRWNPKVQRQHAAPSIEHHAQVLGIQISSKTINQHLAEASNAISLETPTER